jgi:hypothetical protein
MTVSPSPTAASSAGQSVVTSRHEIKLMQSFVRIDRNVITAAQPRTLAPPG